MKLKISSDVRSAVHKDYRPEEPSPFAKGPSPKGLVDKVQALEKSRKEDNQRLLSKAETCRRLRIGDATLSYLIKTKQLSTVRAGKRVKIPAKDVDSLAKTGFQSPR